MSQRIRIGNVYQYKPKDREVVVVHKDHENNVYFRDVKSRDNAGVIATSDAVHHAPYKEFLSCVEMRDYPDDWERKARAIRKRDGHKCQGCGTSPRDFSDSEADGSPRGCGDEDANELHVHHICPLGAGGSNARSNLITLCDKCHGKVHGGVT
jgi:hypothetical protein